ncbi:MAG TPA: Nramp family divalent metal transporter [Sphingomicrobium sp.]|nr:Nramp family divalent metal transporter [Sphingomicrobium sp.]
MSTPPADIALDTVSIEDARRRSLGSVNGSIPVPHISSEFWRKLCAFAGPGYLVAVGYIDPGNWATDLGGGSRFGYTLLSVVLLSNIMAMVLQSLAARLGIATGLDLAQACRESYRREVRVGLWLACEVAIVACDLAEVIGTAIALNLLFALPLVWGVCLTALDVFLILYLQQHGFRKLEAFVIALLIVIAGCFAIELALARPDLPAIGLGLMPSAEILRNPAMLYIAIGIVGATVMPHNLYLHSAVVQTRAFGRSDTAKSDAIRFATLDSSIALGAALFINAAILILSAAAFHATGRTEVGGIEDAYRLLSPALGAGAASALFAIALLASGQNSTVTATLAGQVVMEGFLRIRLPGVQRRMITRGLAILPAALVAGLFGVSGTAKLLLLSQVVLSLQLPFAVVPLVRFTSDRQRMGEHVNPRWLALSAWTICAVIIALDGALLLTWL